MRKTTEEWIELLQAYEPDKQTIKNYCAEHDIAVSSFYQHRSRLQQKQPSNGFIQAKITSHLSTALPIYASCILKTAAGELIFPSNTSPNYISAVIRGLLHADV